MAFNRNPPIGDFRSLLPSLWFEGSSSFISRGQGGMSCMPSREAIQAKARKS